MNTQEEKKFNRDQTLFDTLLTMEFSLRLLDDTIRDTTSELKEMKRLKRSIVKSLTKGTAFYKLKYGRDVRFKI